MAELGRQETIVSRWMRDWASAAAALRLIHDKRLFRVTHRTFAAYVADRWELDAGRASRLVAAAEVLERLRAGGFDRLPDNESQACALANVPAEQLADLWARVVKHAPKGKVTTTFINLQAAELLGVPEGLGNAGDITDDLAALMKALPAETQKRVVQECERRVKATTEQDERQEVKDRPWLRTIREITAELKKWDNLLKPAHVTRALRLLTKTHALLRKADKR